MWGGGVGLSGVLGCMCSHWFSLISLYVYHSDFVCVFAERQIMKEERYPPKRRVNIVLDLIISSKLAAVTVALGISGSIIN